MFRGCLAPTGPYLGGADPGLVLSVPCQEASRGLDQDSDTDVDVSGGGRHLAPKKAHQDERDHQAQRQPGRTLDRRQGHQQDEAEETVQSQ